MKKDSEKKTKVKSIKLTPIQEEQINKMATDKNMNFSEYMLDCALHGNNGMTPMIAIKIQEMVNIVENIVNDLDGEAYMRREELRQRAEDFGDFFKSPTPQEKLNRLENNMGLFIEGGYEIWEFLK